MFKELTVGAKKIAFLSNGLTPIFYKQLFGTDLLQQLTQNGEFEIAGDKVPELAYVMAMQGKKADMTKLSIEGYYEWLADFEPLDIVVHGSEIAKVYLSNSLPSVDPKKKANGKAKE